MELKLDKLKTNDTVWIISDNSLAYPDLFSIKDKWSSHGDRYASGFYRDDNMLSQVSDIAYRFFDSERDAWEAFWEEPHKIGFKLRQVSALSKQKIIKKSRIKLNKDKYSEIIAILVEMGIEISDIDYPEDIKATFLF